MIIALKWGNNRFFLAGKPIFIELSNRRLEFEEDLRLDQARDESGNINVKTICITRQIPRKYHLKYRYSLLMRLFSQFNKTGMNKTGISSEPALFEHLFLKSLSDRHRFQLRMHDEIKKNPEGNNLIYNDVEHGNMKLPDARLTGIIYETRNGIEIVARLIDNATSELLAGKDVYGESKNHSALTSLADKLAEKFLREFPLTEGVITWRKKRKIIADIEDSRIKTGWPLILYRNEHIDKMRGVIPRLLAALLLMN